MGTNMHYGASKIIFENADVLRQKMTETEKMVWQRLCKNQLHFKIRRQHPVYKYITDFYCHELKLVIEIDGGIHLLEDSKKYDINRDITLKEFEIEIIRFTNDQVINEIDGVIQKIKMKMEELREKKIPNTIR